MVSRSQKSCTKKDPLHHYPNKEIKRWHRFSVKTFSSETNHLRSRNTGNLRAHVHYIRNKALRYMKEPSHNLFHKRLLHLDEPQVLHNGMHVFLVYEAQSSIQSSIEILYVHSYRTLVFISSSTSSSTASISCYQQEP